MATKATAKNEVWQAQGAEAGRDLLSPEIPAWMKKQIEQSVRCYSVRADRQAKAWMDGYLRVVGY